MSAGAEMHAEAERRFAFGANWESFIRTSYTPLRRARARQDLLSFLGVEHLDGLSFLDIGSGSGLHSLAALDAGVARIHSFDYDPLSVRTTQYLRHLAGDPAHWHVEQGDVLDDAYLGTLGTFDVVYSWGVLHHTGAMWRAIDNAAALVRPGGLFFVALYSSNVATPSTAFWLDVKRRYNAAGAAGRRRMEWWYIWRFGLGRNVLLYPVRLPRLLRQVYDRRRQRGMSYMADVRDWLGGWPMEYADDQAVVDRLAAQHGQTLVNVATGEACTQFLFRNEGAGARAIAVADFAAGRARPVGTRRLDLPARESASEAR